MMLVIDWFHLLAATGVVLCLMILAYWAGRIDGRRCERAEQVQHTFKLCVEARNENI